MTYFPGVKQLEKFHFYLKLLPNVIHFVSNEKTFKKSFAKKTSQVAPQVSTILTTVVEEIIRFISIIRCEYPVCKFRNVIYKQSSALTGLQNLLFFSRVFQF